MKKVFFIAVLPVLTLFLLAFYYEKTPVAKINNSLVYQSPEEETFFWFSVRVSIDDKKQAYKIVGSPSGISQGSLKEFEKAIWMGLRKRQIVVGAFRSKQEAMNARMLYRSKREKIKKMPKIEGTVYWFAIHFEESKRLRIYIIRRKPGAIENGEGNLNFFIAAFFEQLNFEMFTIGPFTSYEDAELMKRLYRKNE